MDEDYERLWELAGELYLDYGMKSIAKQIIREANMTKEDCIEINENSFYCVDMLGLISEMFDN